MPNPKDYLDDEHEYVRGYVRRKRDANVYIYSEVNPNRVSWFRRIKWYWRVLIGLGGLIVFVALVQFLAARS